MKNTTFGILLSFFLLSCETEFQHAYVIKNSTSHRIAITGYDKVGSFSVVNDSIKDAPETIIIEPNSEFKNVQEAGYHADNQGIFDAWGMDSITIVFDSDKIIYYACDKSSGVDCPGKYNLINYRLNFTKETTGRSSGEDEYTYTFTFSEEDYDNAEMIE